MGMFQPGRKTKRAVGRKGGINTNRKGRARTTVTKNKQKRRVFERSQTSRKCDGIFSIFSAARYVSRHLLSLVITCSMTARSGDRSFGTCVPALARVGGETYVCPYMAMSDMKPRTHARTLFREQTHRTVMRYHLELLQRGKNEE